MPQPAQFCFSRSPFRSALLGASLFAVALSQSCPTHAQSASPAPWDGGYTARAERRSDVLIGVSTGAALANARGTPNELDKLGIARFEANTRMALGSTFDLWLGGALQDWISVAFAVGSGRVTPLLGGNGLRAQATFMGLRIEAYPLYRRGGLYRDLGVAASFGVGLLTGETEEGRTKVIDGGAMSAVGVSLFWESLRLGHVAVGPSLEYRHLFSQSAAWDAATLGLRVAFYTGPRRREAETGRPAQTAFR